MRFKSIQTKYVLLVTVSILLSTLLVGGVCVRNAYNDSMKHAAENMNLTCESYMHKYDATFRDVQNTVEMTSSYATERLETIERFATDETYREEYATRLEDFLRFATENSRNVSSYYVRFSPDLLQFERGFRFSRSSNSEAFKRLPILKIQDYQPSDDEHVGWYYTPISTGKTTWLEPYFNANSQQEMVSCVTPFYKDGTIVGVIGMDINFSSLIDDLQDLRIFDNGYAFLCDASGKVYYHPLYPADTFIQQDVQGFDAQLGNESSGSQLYDGVSKGENIAYAFRTLTNGMRLVLRAPVNEIGAEALGSMRTIGLLTLAAALVSISITVVVCQRITKPLADLTTAAAMLASGQYDVKIDVTTQDEVGVLARTLQVAAAELKANAERMRQLALKDTLTGVRNKTAYELETKALEEEVRDGLDSFGIAVFDINDLKTANDVYGHQQGDKVIKIGCNRICQVFSHCPVFRIGGDEFVAIIRGDEVNHVDERLAEFAARTKEENDAAKQPQDKVQVAVGVSFFDPKTDTCIEDVFNRADERMYENKQSLKQA